MSVRSSLARVIDIFYSYIRDDMKYYLILILIVINLTACASHDESYYRFHPQALQTALKQCPNKQPKRLTCEELAAIASRLNNLAIALQRNPQYFGKRILALQETLAKQQKDSQMNSKDVALMQMIETTQQQLREYLAVVKWLESPEG